MNSPAPTGDAREALCIYLLSLRELPTGVHPLSTGDNKKDIIIF